jgi:hypothetical protein
LFQPWNKADSCGSSRSCVTASCTANTI